MTKFTVFLEDNWFALALIGAGLAFVYHIVLCVALSRRVPLLAPLLYGVGWLISLAAIPIGFLPLDWLGGGLRYAAQELKETLTDSTPGKSVVPPVSVALAYLFGFLGIGGLALTGVTFVLLEEKYALAQVVLVAATVGFVLAGIVLAFGRVWSFWLGTVLGAGVLHGIGGKVVQPIGDWLAESGRSLRGLEFVRPEWLVLLIFVPVVFVLSRKSLSGLGPTRKWVAISTRALLIALLAFALAEPRLKRQSEHVTVLFVVDRSFSVPQDFDPDKPVTDAVDRRWEKTRNFIEQAVQRRGPDKRNDQVGLVLFGKRPKLALPPAAVDRMPIDERMAGPIDGNYTNIEAAIKQALASFPEGTGKRIVLVSDGNENIGNAEEQAALAKQNGVQIDTIALAPGFKNENEVLVEAVEAPPVTTPGQKFLVRVLVRNATPDRIVDGRLEVAKATTGETKFLEIEDGPQVLEPGNPAKVRLPARELSVFRFRDEAKADGDSAFAYRATFTPTESRAVRGGSAATSGLPGDRATNNRAAAAVVARGTRRVLFLDEAQVPTRSPHAHLIRVLRDNSKLNVRWWPASRLPIDKGELGVFLSNYDCIIIANVPAETFTHDQMEIIRSNVYDQGCGLIMLGGPDSFGAGGYQTTPIEAALPVDCEIKAAKAAGKGGLVLIMHASEMADGNKWQKEIAKLAIQRLGPEDMVGVTQYGFGGGSGVNWHIPFQRVGDRDSSSRKNLLAKVDSMMPGDMPDFDPFLRAAVDTLKDEKHGLSVKHSIVISDGDPNFSGPGIAALTEMAEKGITLTTVGVATHGVNEDAKMKKMAESTKDGNGKTGTFYKVTNPNQLPGIYIKESRRVSQSFIHDKPFVPTTVGGAGTSDVLAPGLPNPLPGLGGFVRTTKKENVLSFMALEGPTPYPDQRFPLLASWRYGLGKAVAFTSDARTVPGSATLGWDKDWASSDMYQKFWEQVVNWAMREAERGRLGLVTEYRDGKVRITADVRDEKDRPLSGLTLRGAVTPPNAPAPGEKAPTVEFKPKGGGIYEAEFPAEEAGSYFVNVQAAEAERGADGTVKLKTIDAARAGVTVPYSPEFADLESNTPLMRQLAAATDGQFHTESDDDLNALLKSGALFRDAPSTTRAILPFWFWLVFLAALLLLLDVGIRRISLELAEVRRWIINIWAGARRQPLLAEEPSGLGQLLRRKAAVDDAIDRGRTSRKFDPAQARGAEPAPAGADEYVSNIPTGPTTPTAPTGDRTVQPVEEEDALSRLRKAKLRAKHQREKRDDDPG